MTTSTPTTPRHQQHQHLELQYKVAKVRYRWQAPETNPKIGRLKRGCPQSTKNGHSPVSTAIRASSIWHLICVRTLHLSPSLQIASQSRRDCSEAAGDVSSMYSTPKASRALAMAILVLVSKKALANCSPSGFHVPKQEEPERNMSHSSLSSEAVTRGRTPQSALNDLEVCHIVQEVRCTRCIRVSPLCGPVRYTIGVTIDAVSSLGGAPYALVFDTDHVVPVDGG